MPVLDIPTSTMARLTQSRLSGPAWLRARSVGSREPGDVLFHAPSFCFQAAGGGENQLVQTGLHLELMGRNVRLFSPWVDRLEDFRVLHLFGMSREGLELARVAKRRKIPIALSTISWFEPRAMAALASNKIQGWMNATKWLCKSLMSKLRCWRRELLELADIVLPNSRSEADQLARLFGTGRDKFRVVPNGVDPRFAQASSAQFVAQFGNPAEVLYVGRIEKRKNVLGLIQAVIQARLELTVIGRVPPGSEEYARACQTAGANRVRFLPCLEHDDPLLASAYASARVFALPSWFETPGLAALEAGLAGAAIVITPNGCTKEYFLDQAVYAAPNDVRGIAGALIQAVETGPHPGLAARLRANYPWTEVARRTAEAYDHLAQ